MKKNNKNRVKYICPFCKKEIVASKKTEIFYQSEWIDGCSDCFALSIKEDNRMTFQESR